MTAVNNLKGKEDYKAQSIGILIQNGEPIGLISSCNFNHCFFFGRIMQISDILVKDPSILTSVYARMI